MGTVGVRGIDRLAAKVGDATCDQVRCMAICSSHSSLHEFSETSPPWAGYVDDFLHF